MMIFVENKTQWDTASIKAFYKPIIEHEGLLDAPTQITAVNQYKQKARTLERNGVNYLLSPRYNHSRAYIGKIWIKKGRGYSTKLALWLPEDMNEANRTKLIQVAMHEFAHCRGIKSHKEMGDCWSFDTSWFPKDLNLQLKQASDPKPRDLRQERYAHALKKLKEAESKAKRWANKVKAYRKKVKYYEKVVA